MTGKVEDIAFTLRCSAYRFREQITGDDYTVVRPATE